MQILHLNGFTHAEVEERKCIIYSNTVRSMLELLEAKSDLCLEFEDKNMMNYAISIRKHIENGLEFAPFNSQIKEAIQKLWQDPNIRIAYEKRADYHIHDSSSYYFENIERIAEKDYRPTNQDILHTRVPTTGVVKLLFTLNGIDFKQNGRLCYIFDVGGQRSERRKWIHIFDDVNAIIFVVAISEYDQKIREDNATNRLLEALELFESITNSMFFSKSSMILFLNKIDIFSEKIKKISLNIIFSSYKGGLNYQDGVAYLRKKFLRLYRNKQKLYIHETCATDTTQLESVFNSVLDTIVQENLQDTGML
ncbi:unnamed protein product [Meloidogyne enterolobii]|uniref:Uncharacterized protein n=1 Tax=Meloidogyne enterolobii TaxID=390850 RepID=A0ACB1B6J6_MELEN